VKNTELIALLLEALRGRTGRWDVIKDAISSTGDTVRLIAVILALTISTAAGALVVYLVASR
jgi:succinate dehydrogenase hydrophobic anchor subunit